MRPIFLQLQDVMSCFKCYVMLSCRWVWMIWQMSRLGRSPVRSPLPRYAEFWTHPGKDTFYDTFPREAIRKDMGTISSQSDYRPVWLLGAENERLLKTSEFILSAAHYWRQPGPTKEQWGQMQKQEMRRRDLQVRSCPFVYTGGSEPILEKGKDNQLQRVLLLYI